MNVEFATMAAEVGAISRYVFYSEVFRSKVQHVDYDYAVSKGVPVLGFVIENDAAWPTDRVETESATKQALDRFKAKVKQKPVSFWTTAADLHGKFSIALMIQIATTPRPGWARATDVAGPEVIKELTR